MSASRLRLAFSDPFGFHAALQDLRLAPEDLPGITRELRLTGDGR